MANRIDVTAVIDNQRLARFQIVLVLMIAAAAFLEGFDSQLQGYTAPTLTKLWHISRSSYSPVFVFFQIGFMLGAVTLGNLGDIVGRRLTIILGVLLFGLCTIAGAYATDVTTLTATRFLSAVFLGSAIPNSISLTIDYAPHRHRALWVGYLFISYTAGSSLGGVFAAWLVPSYGWQSIYWLCGVLSLGLGVLLYFRLPESVRFMALRHRTPQVLAATIRKLAPDLVITPDTEFVMPRSIERRAWVGELFSEHRAAMTVALWVAYGLSLMALIFVTSWMPTIYSDSGMSYSTSVIATALFQGGGIAGALFGGWVLDRERGILSVSALCLAAVPALICIGQSAGTPALLMLLTAIAGFCIVGTHTGLNALSGSLYPTALRSTGAGWASGIGRVGAIIGPLLGALLIGLHLSLPIVFLIVSAPSFCIAMALLVIHFARPGERDARELPIGQPSGHATGGRG
jgi:AAHS family 4-hydroxybenzoate transporter-like MFS transporter